MLQFVTPLPPLASGIAQYSRDLLRAVDGQWHVNVLAEHGSGRIRGTTIATTHRIDPGLPAIFQIGNSEFHAEAFRRARGTSGVLVLHDVVLHHARLAAAVRHGNSKQYIRDMARLYGDAGATRAREILRGVTSPDLLDFPLSEDYVSRARATIVHNAFARKRVLERAPEATVIQAPMGIPLPALVDRGDARRVLNLPESAFIIASITHINPLKRMPVVLRALRRVIRRVPETLFVIAGTEAPGTDVKRRVELLGLGDRVRRLGYVTDDTARLLARAADVCVNLRYPATGETSASLLRLLGAGRPVLVTDGAASSELPPDVGLKVPVDPLEEEYLAELIVELASDDDFRNAAGIEARSYIEREHTMQAAVDGYRHAILEAFGIALPAIDDHEILEAAPRMEIAGNRRAEPARSSPLDRRLADAVDDLRLGSHGGTIQTLSKRSVELGLDTMTYHDPTTEPGDHNNAPIRQDLLDILACPICKTPVRLEGRELVCDSCSRRYAIENGVPIMLVDDDS